MLGLVKNYRPIRGHISLQINLNQQGIVTNKFIRDGDYLVDSVSVYKQHHNWFYLVDSQVLAYYTESLAALETVLHTMEIKGISTCRSMKNIIFNSN